MNADSLFPLKVFHEIQMVVEFQKSDFSQYDVNRINSFLAPLEADFPNSNRRDSEITVPILTPPFKSKKYVWQGSNRSLQFEMGSFRISRGLTGGYRMGWPGPAGYIKKHWVSLLEKSKKIGWTIDFWGLIVVIKFSTLTRDDISPGALIAKNIKAPGFEDPFDGEFRVSKRYNSNLILNLTLKHYEDFEMKINPKGSTFGLEVQKQDQGVSVVLDINNKAKKLLDRYDPDTSDVDLFLNAVESVDQILLKEVKDLFDGDLQ